MAGALAVAAAALVVSGGPAQASWNQCGSGYACAWDAADYTGGLLIAQSSSWANFESANNDRASSIANRTSGDVGWYTAGGLAGSRYCQTSGNSNNYVGNDWNDKFSSVIVYGSGGYC